MNNDEQLSRFTHEASGWNVVFKARLTFGEVVGLVSSLGRISSSGNGTLDGEAFVELRDILERLINEIRDKDGNAIALNDVPFGELMVILPHVIEEMVAASTAGLPTK